MSSYADGEWTHTYPTCPSCCLIRLSQGFKMPPELGDYCPECTQARKDKEYYASEPYVAWKTLMDAFVSTLPISETMAPNPELTAWLEANPPPSRSS